MDTSTFFCERDRPKGVLAGKNNTTAALFFGRRGRDTFGFFSMAQNNEKKNLSFWLDGSQDGGFTRKLDE